MLKASQVMEPQKLSESCRCELPSLTGRTANTNDTTGSQLAAVAYFFDQESKMIHFCRAFTVRCVRLAKLADLADPMHVTASNSVTTQ